MGNSTYIVCSSLTMHFNSFTTSDNAMYSASVVDSTTHFIPFLLHAIGIPQNYMMYPKTLILVSLSLAKSLSLSAFSAHFMKSFYSSNFSPYPLVDSRCLIIFYISFRCTSHFRPCNSLAKLFLQTLNNCWLPQPGFLAIITLHNMNI